MLDLERAAKALAALKLKTLRHKKTFRVPILHKILSFFFLISI